MDLAWSEAGKLSVEPRGKVNGSILGRRKNGEELNTRSLRPFELLLSLHMYI